MTTTTETLTGQITAILAADEWQPRWAACQNAMTDPYGNTVAIHDQGETILIEFEYALPGSVETMHLDPTHGARRIAMVIIALAAPQE
jgi:hypothetical protein